MEAEIIVEGFRRSIEMHGLKYANLVGDGDSSVSRKLADARPYQNLIVHKIECRNHLLRNFCNHIKDLTAKRISSSRQIVSTEQRQHLKGNIKRFRTAIQSAVKYRCAENISLEEKVASLRRDILNSVNHIFGDHANCAEYFCKNKETTNERNWISEMTGSGLLQDIGIVLTRLIQHADSLLLDMDNNSAECYNSVVAKFIGGKRINFSGRDSYQLRCQAAGISFNAGSHEYPQLLWRSITKRSPGKFVKSYSSRMKQISLKLKKRRALFPAKLNKKPKLLRLTLIMD